MEIFVQILGAIAAVSWKVFFCTTISFSYCWGWIQTDFPLQHCFSSKRFLIGFCTLFNQIQCKWLELYVCLFFSPFAVALLLCLEWISCSMTQLLEKKKYGSRCVQIFHFGFLFNLFIMTVLSMFLYAWGNRKIIKDQIISIISK